MKSSGDIEQTATVFQRVGVAGAGAWGTALAVCALAAGRDVKMWAFESDIAASLSKGEGNPVFLPGAQLPAINASTAMSHLADCDAILAVAPAQHLRATLRALRPHLKPGTPIALATTWTSADGRDASALQAAADVINGAGLLFRQGQPVTNWHTVENLKPDTFTAMRHPRTLIGVDREGDAWLVVVDGRQPDYSAGMTFAELVRLCERLGLTDALNLDGGGSTTMVVKGQIVNRPSDASGPRPVSDAVVVRAR